MSVSRTNRPGSFEWFSDLGQEKTRELIGVLCACTPDDIRPIEAQIGPDKFRDEEAGGFWTSLGIEVDFISLLSCVGEDMSVDDRRFIIASAISALGVLKEKGENLSNLEAQAAMEATGKKWQELKAAA